MAGSTPIGLPGPDLAYAFKWRHPALDMGIVFQKQQTLVQIVDAKFKHENDDDDGGGGGGGAGGGGDGDDDDDDDGGGGGGDGDGVMLIIG